MQILASIHNHNIVFLYKIFKTNYIYKSLSSLTILKIRERVKFLMFDSIMIFKRSYRAILLQTILNFALNIKIITL